MSTMKVVVDPSGDDAIYFHVDVRLSTDAIYRPESAKANERNKKLLVAIREVPGVQEASINRYKVLVQRSRAVEWSNISSAVEAAIRAAVEENEGKDLQ